MADRAALLSMSRGAVRGFFEAEGYPEPELDAIAAQFFEWLEVGDNSRRDGQAFRPWLVGRLERFAEENPPPRIEVTGEERSENERPKDEPPPCKVCGAVGAARLPDGSCAACWLSLVVSSRRTQEPLPECFGDYAIIEQLGVGGESIVYRARQRGSDRDVALKVPIADAEHSPDLVERFRQNARLVARLDHPRILRIDDRSGLGAERPFYTMPLVDGGTLADRVEAFRDPRQAARLMITIARAVQYAHEHGILHRDLKPHNVLLESHDKPVLIDFMAKPIAGRSKTSLGSFNYMPWEQAAGKGSVVASDVYGLGAIFYELLTGRPPLEASSLEEVKELHERGAIVPIRDLVRSVDPGLEAVCWAALSRETSLRHRSAGLFADSLECVLKGHAPPWPEASRRARLGLWCRRHPFLSLGGCVGLLAVLLADIATFQSARSERGELLTATLRSNTALASSQARAVLALFDQHAGQVARAALDPSVGELAARGVPSTSAPVLRELLERARGVDSIGLFDENATMLARYPTPPDGYLGKTFEFREYYRCARARATELARNVAYDSAQPLEARACLSSAYRGEISEVMEFATSAPIFDRNHEWIGLVVMARHANRTLGDVEIDDPYDSGQATTLFGWRGADRGAQAPRAKPRLTVVAHPGLYSPQEFALPPALNDELVAEFGMGDGPPRSGALRARRWEERDYFDPVDKQYKLAGFAPVGKTGYVVGVATPHERALGANQRHVDSLLGSMALLNFGFLLVALVAIGATLREGRLPARRDE